MANWSVVPDVAERAFMDMMFWYDGQLTFHLFGNQFGVHDSMTIGDLTELTYPGYSPVVLTGLSASEDYYSAGGYAGKQAGIPVKTLNFPQNTGGTVNCYGLYATYKDPNGVDQLLYAANVFDTTGGYTPTPTGIAILGMTFPPTLFAQIVLWDFNQPTGP